MKWKVKSSDYISRHPYFTARKDVCERPDGSIVDAYYVVEIPASACALALTEDGKAIMVRQYRHPIGETLLELPGGFIDENENPADAIKRELMEETGYEFTSVELLAKVAANPGVLNGFTYLFLAKGGKKVAEQQLDDNEDIVIELIPLDKVKEFLRDNKITQALHVCCLFYAFEKMG